jgi:hypothetical protein
MNAPTIKVQSTKCLAALDFDDGCRVEFIHLRSVDLDGSQVPAGIPPQAKGNVGKRRLVRVTGLFKDANSEKRQTVDIEIDMNFASAVQECYTAVEATISLRPVKLMDCPKTVSCDVGKGIEFGYSIHAGEVLQTLLLITCAAGSARLNGTAERLEEFRANAYRCATE